MDVHTDRLNINGDWKLPEKIAPSDWSVENVMIAKAIIRRPGKIRLHGFGAYQKLMIDSAEDRACNYGSLLCQQRKWENTGAVW